MKVFQRLLIKNLALKSLVLLPFCYCSFALAEGAESAKSAEMKASLEVVEFVTCPIYRDTRNGKKSGCWLVDDPQTAIRYDVSFSPTKPNWNFQVLVEGIVAENQEDVCGGKVLTPVRVSILPAKCPAYKLEAEGYTSREFQRPARITHPLSAKRDAPLGPFTDKVFHVFFDFNKSFISYQFGDYFLDQAIHWITHAKPKQLIVTGYADTQSRKISGVELAEDKAVAEHRAQNIAKSLIRMGIPEQDILIKLNYQPDIIDADGVDGIPATSRRRVDIAATF